MIMLEGLNTISNDYGIKFILSNFSLAMFFLAVIFIFFHRLFSHRPPAEIIYRWIAFFPLGLTGIYAFIMHAYYPDVSAMSIGWKVSPFQFEVAVADLAFGLLGILSFCASYGFRLATVLGSAIFLWGDAIGHINQMLVYKNYSPANAGSWFWMDVLIPFILFLCVIKLKPTSLPQA